MQRLSILTLFVLMLVLANAVQAQWNLQSPIPTNNNLNGAAFVSATHIFVCGENDILLESTDAGVTWIKRMGALRADPYYAVHFADPLHGYLTGNGIDAWGTSDGGATWFQMTSAPGGSMRHLDFITPMIGFIGGNGELAFTSNGGVNWVTKSIYPSCPVIDGMDFRDAQVGLVGGIMAGTSEEGIFKTTDAGSTWTNKFPSSANDVIWMNNSEAIATISTSIYRSTDVGETWTAIASGITTGLLDLERTGSTTVVGVSLKGDIWRSTDGGFSWSWVLDGLGDLPAQWSVSFYDSLNGLVVGQGGLMYSTHDGGITWKMLNNGMGVQIYDLEMHTRQFGICAGNNGYVFSTTNGGALWKVTKVEVTGQIFGRDESLRAASVVDSAFAVVAGPGGIVFRTYNAGTNWESIGYPVLPGTFWIEDVKFVSRTEGWVVGLDQNLGHDKTVYHTTDGGATWTLGMNNAAYWYSVDFVDPQHGWIVSAGGSSFRTTNGGAAWLSSALPPYFTSPSISKMRFIDQNNGWVVGWDGYVAHTTNGGNNWTLVNIGTTTDHLFGVSVVSPSEVWAVGRENYSFDGLVYHTINNGVTWTREVVSHYTEDLPYSISAFPLGEVWFGGFNGRIFKNNNDPLPIQLGSFTGTVVEGGNVRLTWSTISEINNYGFYVQRKRPGGQAFVEVPNSFVPGHGTTNEPHTYTFTDATPGRGAWMYRLKQVDLNGETHYSDPISVDVVTGTAENNVPIVFELAQNYPNPFNPTTAIRFEIPQPGFVSLKVFDVLGREVATLVHEEKSPGSYSVRWDATNVGSGTYFCRLESNGRHEIKKMLLTK